jgi:hypothetical protein
MIIQLEALLETLKQRNNSYYTEIGKLHAQIEECTAICNKVEGIIDRYKKQEADEL